MNEFCSLFHTLFQNYLDNIFRDTRHYKSNASRAITCIYLFYLKHIDLV